MGVRKGQKRAERIKRAPAELLSRQFQSVYQAAKANNMFYLILINSRKLIAKLLKALQILIISEENMLAKYITQLSITRYLSKHIFIFKPKESSCLKQCKGIC